MPCFGQTWSNLFIKLRLENSQQTDECGAETGTHDTQSVLKPLSHHRPRWPPNAGRKRPCSSPLPNQRPRQELNKKDDKANTKGHSDILGSDCEEPDLATHLRNSKEERLAGQHRPTTGGWMLVPVGGWFGEPPFSSLGHSFLT